MNLPSRTEIDPKYRFDLTEIFDAPADWSTAREDLHDRLERLESLAADTPETAAELEELLAETEACYERRQRLELYAQLSKNVNTDSESAADRERALRETMAAFEPVAATVRRALGDLSEETFEDLGGSLEEYRYYATNLRRQASHVRSPAVEDVIADHEEARSGSDRILREITTTDFDPPTLERPDGETVDVRMGNYRTELSNPDRDYRRRVYEAYHAERNRFAATIVRASAEKLAAAATEADLRGYESIRDRDLRGTYPESGLEPALPESVHDTILEAVRANLEPYHRAQRVRREKLGLETLRPWDRRVSLADSPAPDLDYEEARELILESLAPLGEEYVARARTFLDDRRIDVYPTQDKRTDIPAYCPSSAVDGAFVLANFREDVRTTFFVAHELGHALAVAYNREGPTRYATCPTAVCEIPSILHELLLAEHCLKRGGPLAAHARNRLIECLAGNLYRNARTAAYNHALATTVESGEELTVERARSAYADLLEEFDPVYDRDGVPERTEGTGLRIPYSSYQYVLGATGALAVRDRLRDGTLAADEYRGFLGRTGQRPPLESFAALDLDVRSHEPFERAAATFDGYLDELESI